PARTSRSLMGPFFPQAAPFQPQAPLSRFARAAVRWRRARQSRGLIGPANPNLPTHLRGALVTHLVLAAIGPVQELIASARRCRDLWFGSWVLSELAKAAARGALEVQGPIGARLDAVSFPGTQGLDELSPGSHTSVANELLLRVRGDGALAREVAEAGQWAMQERLRTIRDAAFED